MAGLRGQGLEAGWLGLLSQSWQCSVVQLTKAESTLLESTPGFSKNDATPFMVLYGFSTGQICRRPDPGRWLCSWFMHDQWPHGAGDCSVGSMPKPHPPLP